MLPWLPAALAMAVWLPIGLLAVWTPEKIERDYVQYADRALLAGHYTDARIACERLLSLDSPQRPFHIYRMAVCLAGLGQREAALELFGMIAVETSPAFGAAHRIIAEIILADPAADAAALRVAESHLKQAQSSAESPDSKILEMLGQLYGRRQEWTTARDYFTRAYQSNPRMSLPLAALAAAQGREEEKLRWAVEAASLFQAETGRNPSDPSVRQSWAQALLLANQHSQALAVVREGIKQRDLPAYHKLAADIIAAWLHASGQSPGALAARLNLIEQGLRHDPTNRDILRELISASNLQGAEAVPARALLQLMLARGDSAPVVHFCLGMDAWRNRDLQACRAHFEVVFKQYPVMAVVGNNLAWLLTFTEPHDYDRALEIMNAVLLRHPDVPGYRETRGQIFTRLGRWTDAVADLEFALTAKAGSPATHTALAVAYEGLGMKQLAREHRELAKPRAGE